MRPVACTQSLRRRRSFLSDRARRARAPDRTIDRQHLLISAGAIRRKAMIRNSLALLLLTVVVAAGPARPAQGEESQNSEEVRLTESQMKLIELETAAAETGTVGTDLVVNGEITA